MKHGRKDGWTQAAWMAYRKRTADYYAWVLWWSWRVPLDIFDSQATD